MLVLILSTFRPASVPVLTNSAAHVDKDLNFEIDDKAQVFKSCSLTWQNELFVFGGDNEKKTQISKVTSCRLELIGQLAFNHIYGDCVNVSNKKVILCFNNERVAPGDYKKCRMASSPTDTFSEMALSQYKHRNTRIATNNGEFRKLQNKINCVVFNSELIIAVGGFDPSNKKSELLDVNGNNWSSADDYPSDWGLI